MAKYEVQMFWEVAAKVTIEAESQEAAEAGALGLTTVQLRDAEACPAGILDVDYQGYVDDSLQVAFTDCVEWPEELPYIVRRAMDGIPEIRA